MITVSLLIHASGSSTKALLALEFLNNYNIYAVFESLDIKFTEFYSVFCFLACSIIFNHYFVRFKCNNRLLTFRHLSYFDKAWKRSCSGLKIHSSELVHWKLFQSGICWFDWWQQGVLGQLQYVTVWNLTLLGWRQLASECWLQLHCSGCLGPFYQPRCSNSNISNQYNVLCPTQQVSILFLVQLFESNTLEVSEASVIT